MIFIIMILSGLFGGVVNFLTKLIDGTSDNKTVLFFSCVLGGVASSLMVPLFLGVIGSDIVSVQLKSDSSISKEMLTFMGFCLIASISSSRFIGVLSNKMISMVESAQREASEANKNAIEAKTILAELTEDEDEGESAEGDVAKIELTRDQETVLVALNQGTVGLRSIQGLHITTKIEQETITSCLQSLSEKKLVSLVETPKGIRWKITNAGKTFISEKK